MKGYLGVTWLAGPERGGGGCVFVQGKPAEASLHLALHLKLALVAIHTTAAVKEGTSFETMIGLIVAVKSPFSVKEHPKECGFTLV